MRAPFIHFPQFWSQDNGIDYGAPVLHLRDLLPRVGGNVCADFDGHVLVSAGATLHVIWCPPVSDLNGWSEQPSEIGQSFVLEADVVRSLPSSIPGRRRFELNVLSCERLLTVLRALLDDVEAALTPEQRFIQPDRQAWDEVSWSGRAAVEEFTYLTASTPHEAFMALIVKEVGDGVIGLFSLHSDPGGDFCALGGKRLVGEELATIKRALDTAQPLLDTQAAYLV
ncbi:hypothetical protein [Pseudomonas sp. NPDC089534]|uniref:hypothetical protein n=1 Tax=Pseudomonas sp. NPDC089534 TaxID=3364468 RepID=UPI003803173B